MDGMEKITARMQSDADDALEKLRMQTEQECSAVRAEYRKRAEEECAALRARSEQAAQERYERLCSASEMETRKLRLAAKQEVLRDTYALALDKLCTMPQEQYEALLCRLLGKASETGDEQIRLCPEDREKLGEAFVQRANEALHTHFTLSDRTADIRAGFVLVGKMSDVNCSFETLLALSRERSEQEAADRLFS